MKRITIIFLTLIFYWTGLIQATWKFMHPLPNAGKCDQILPAGDGSLYVAGTLNGIIQIDADIEIQNAFKLPGDFSSSSHHYCSSLMKNFDSAMYGVFDGNFMKFNPEGSFEYMDFCNVYYRYIGEILPGQDGGLWFIVEDSWEGDGNHYGVDQYLCHNSPDIYDADTVMLISSWTPTGDQLYYGFLALSDRSIWMVRDHECAVFNGDYLSRRQIPTNGHLSINGRNLSNLYIADEGGRLLKFQNDKWEIVAETDEHFIFLRTDFNHQPWVITDEGRIGYWSDSQFNLTGTIPDAEQLTFEPGGTVWVAGNTSAGCMQICRYDGSIWTQSKPGITDSDLNDAAIWENMIAAVGDNGTFILGYDTEWYSILDDHTLDDFNSLDVDPTGTIWIAGKTGLFRLTTSSLERVLTGNFRSVCTYDCESMITVKEASLYKYEGGILSKIWTDPVSGFYFTKVLTKDGRHIHAILSNVLPFFNDYAYFDLESCVEPLIRISLHGTSCLRIGPDELPYVVVSDITSFGWSLCRIAEGTRQEISSGQGSIQTFCINGSDFWMTGNGITGNADNHCLFRLSQGQNTEIMETGDDIPSTLLIRDQSVYALGRDGMVWMNNYSLFKINAELIGGGEDLTSRLDIDLKTGDRSGIFELYIVLEIGEIYYSLDSSSIWMSGCAPIIANLPAGLDATGSIVTTLPNSGISSSPVFYTVLFQDGDLLDFDQTAPGVESIGISYSR